MNAIRNTQYAIRTSAVLLFLFLSYAPIAEAAIKLKIAVVNPSSTATKTTSVRYDLPKGIEPEHIIDTGGMELGYDFDKETYYVFQKVTLQPSEKKILNVELEDIWVVPDKDIEFFRTHTHGLVKRLEDTKHAEVGLELAKVINKKLDEIAKKQGLPTLSAREKMNIYYENIGVLDEIKKNIGMLENLVIDVGGIVEERVQVPETLAVSVPEEKGIGPWETIELKVKVSNPSEKRKQTANLKYPLPEEVTPSAIVDASGLDIGYDFTKECYYAFKNDIELEPGEEKVYVIKMKDIWRIPQVELDALSLHTQNLILLLKGTEYFAQGEAIANKVFFNLEEIETSQNLKVPPPEHIAYYRDNVKTFKSVKKYVAHLEKIVSKAGASPGITIARAEKEKGGGEEVKRVRGYEGIAFIAKSIFRGKAPTPATTWKVIFGIIGFIGIVSVAFFALWHAQLRRERRRAEERKAKTP